MTDVLTYPTTEPREDTATARHIICPECFPRAWSVGVTASTLCGLVKRTQGTGSVLLSTCAHCRGTVISHMAAHGVRLSP